MIGLIIFSIILFTVYVSNLKKRGYFNGSWTNNLPLFLLLIIPLYLIINPRYGLIIVFTRYISVFLVSLFTFSLFFLLLPYLRKHYEAKTIACLWTIPYVSSYFLSIIIPRFNLWLTKWIIFVPWKMLVVIQRIWFIGFILTFLYYIINHFYYKKMILKNAREFKTDLTSYPVVISDAVCSPMSIGFSKNKAKIILPDKSYRNDELELIFKHEVLHLQREDACLKFALCFTNSFCWFNPLIYKTTKKCSEDIELSVDQMVCETLDESQKKQYASLIIDHCDKAKGFTTCLSQSKECVKYRLSEIINPKAKKLGIIPLIVLILIANFTGSLIAISYDDPKATSTLNHIEKIVSISKNYDELSYTISDPQVFVDYLESLKPEALYGGAFINEELEKENSYLITIKNEDNSQSFIRIGNHALSIDGDSYYIREENLSEFEKLISGCNIKP